jgi:pyruvate dehydrogenase (quinone)
MHWNGERDHPPDAVRAPPRPPAAGQVSRRELFTTTGVAVAALAAAEIGCRAAPAAAASAGGGGADIVPASDAPVVAPKAPIADDGAWTTADVILEKLLAWKVSVIFGIPGDGINPIMDALRRRKDRIRFVQVRHEEAAAFMAAAHAKYTGNLGVCLATTGPGAVHLLNGLYDAKMDGAPVLALTGSTYHDMGGTRHTQDVDVLSLFKDVALYEAMVLGPAHAHTVTDLACRAALTGRGVAHLTVPIDVQGQRVLEERVSRKKGASRASSSFAPAFAQVPSDDQLRAAAGLLNAGSRTAVLVGRGALGAREEVGTLADTLAAPVMKALLGKGVLPDDSPLTTRTTGHLGTLPSKQAIEQCDTLLIVGSTMPWLEFYPKGGQAKVVQIDCDPARLGLRCSVDVGLVGDARLTLGRLLPLLHRRTDRSFLQAAQDGMRAWDATLARMEQDERLPMRPQVVVGALSGLLADDALLAFDCGAHTVFSARHIRMRAKQQLAMAGNHTTMGPALPYVIAAQLAFPDRQCVACVGDGGFTMMMGELLTAVKYQLPITVVVFKNNWLAHVIFEQEELGFPEYGLELQPLDFVKYAEACGAFGVRCEKPSEVRPALEAALRSRRPALVEAVVEAHENPAPPDAYKA